MNIEFVNMEMIKKTRDLKDDDEIIVFYQTDPDLEKIFGFSPEKIGLRVFTVGFYPMKKEDIIDGLDEDEEDEDRDDDRPYIFSILATTRRWLEESKVLAAIEEDLDGII